MSRPRTPAPSEARLPPARPLTPGDVVGGFAVQRVRRIDPAGWTIADALRPGTPGVPATLWTAPMCGTASGPLCDLFARLETLRQLCETSDLPVVAPLAAGVDDGRLFLARERIAGITLAQRLADGPLPAADVGPIATDIACALDALHAFDVPHAPLTPDRILLVPGRPPRARLHDVGLPRVPARACADPALLHAADYLAPEVARGAAATLTADVYALGCVLVECLSGSPPYPHDRPILVLRAHAALRPPRIAAGLGLGPEIDQLLARALHKVPDQRPRTATGLARAARRVLHEDAADRAETPTPRPEADDAVVLVPAADPVVLAPAARAGELARPRRGPSRSAVVLTLLVAASAGLATALFRADRNASGRDPGQVATTRAAAAQRQAAAADAELAAVVRHLDTRRTAQRRALAAAGSAAEQAAAADRVAAAYGAALTTVRSTMPADAATLRAPLARAGRAYRRLAAAARAGNPIAYRVAATTVVARERDAARALLRATG